MTKINVVTASEEDRTFFSEFLNNRLANNQALSFSAQFPYQYAGKTFIFRNYNLYFYLTYKQSQPRFGVVYVNRPDIGKGNFGTVFNLEGRLKQDEEKNWVYKRTIETSKARVIKISHDRNKPKLEKNIKPEIILSPPHLKICAYQRLAFFTVAKKLPGEALDKANTQPSSLKTQLELMANLLHKLQKQAHLYGVMHLDLKPENILKDGVEINIIDFNLSLPGPEYQLPKNTYRGTYLYMSPEAWNGYVSYASDLFSLILMFKAILDDFSMEQIAGSLDCKLHSTSVNFINILPETSEELRRPLIEWLNSLNVINPNDRPSLAEAQRSFVKLCETHYSALKLELPPFSLLNPEQAQKEGLHQKCYELIHKYALSPFNTPKDKGLKTYLAEVALFLKPELPLEQLQTQLNELQAVSTALQTGRQFMVNNGFFSYKLSFNAIPIHAGLTAKQREEIITTYYALPPLQRQQIDRDDSPVKMLLTSYTNPEVLSQQATL